jgi:hypothetical protein
MDIGGLASSALGGGLFGFVGQMANRAFGIWETKEKRKDAKLAYEHELALIDKQMQAGREETEQELAVTATAGSWDGLRASVEADAKGGDSYRWVSAIRTLTRPFLTLETQLGVIVLLFLAKDAGRADLVDTVAETILFSASTALLWWFGERASNPRGRK